MHKNVEIVLGRLVTDPRLQQGFAHDPHRVLREVGLELSEVETAALVATDPRALRAFTAALDTRLCKAFAVAEGQPTLGEFRGDSGPDSGKEMKR